MKNSFPLSTWEGMHRGYIGSNHGLSHARTGAPHLQEPPTPLEPYRRPMSRVLGGSLSLSFSLSLSLA